MLELKNAVKKFKNKKVLNGIDYCFDGGVYGILGPNGAGKTTLIRCITLLYSLNSGNIFFNEKNIKACKEYSKCVGCLPQKFGLFKELTVYEMLSAMAILKEMPKEKIEAEVKRCVDLVNLSDRLNSRVKTLSGGMIRRLGIAQAVLNNPEIILFDEPTAGLDPEERLRFKSIIAALDRKSTIIISTHIVEDVEALCDYILVMNNGKIIKSGTCSEIADCAAGKVYEVKKSDSAALKEPYHIQQQFENNGEIVLRVLSAVTQDGNGIKKMNPKVEDGYICLLKGI